MVEKNFKARTGFELPEDAPSSESVFPGKVGVNTSVLPVAFQVGSNDAILIPVGTTAQRPANLQAGLIRYNANLASFEGCNGSAWGEIGGGIDGITYNSVTNTVTITTANFQGPVATARFGNSTANVTLANTGATITNSSFIATVTPGSITTGNATHYVVSNTSGLHTTQLIFGGQLSIWAGASLAIYSNGANIGVGTTTPSAKLHVVGSGIFTGDFTSNFSDKRLKTNLEKITNAIEIINSLTGYYYETNEKAAKLGVTLEGRQVGLLTQEVEKVLPEVVKIAPVDRGEKPLVKGRYKTMQYEKFAPIFVEGFKALYEMVIAQQKEINALKKKK